MFGGHASGEKVPSSSLQFFESSHPDIRVGPGARFSVEYL